MRLIWAHSPFDPVLDNGMITSMQWHGTQSRGAVSAYLVDDTLADEFPADDDPDVKHWDMLMDNVINKLKIFC